MNRGHRMLGLLLALVMLLPGCAPKPAPEGSASLSAASGERSEAEPQPVTFEGTDLEGNSLSSEVFSQSKLTMVNVWATYCNPCLREMPGLGELAAEYDPAEFQIIGIVCDVWEGEDQTLVESLVQETGAAYPHLLANDSISQAILSSVSGVPTTFFFDGEGTYLGGVVSSADKSTWEELVNELLEGL